ncbi:hypothetical protein lerEdw1_010504, partial [Lerista edwardsae]
KCQDQWEATYGAKKPARLINVIIKVMENNYHDEAVLTSSICAIQGFLKARPFRKECCPYSALFLLLLGALSLPYGIGNECVRGGRTEGGTLVPSPVDSHIFLLCALQLLLYHVEAEAHNKSPDSLLCWLDHGSLVAKKLSLRGISGLIRESDLKADPWSVQLFLLSTLGSIAPDQLNRAMERLEEILPTLREEEEAVFHRKLAASYCALMDHEVAAVRAAAIKHLGLLKHKSTVLQSAEETIGEIVDVLIHLGDRPQVATNKTMEALSTGAGGDTGLYEKLESLPAQLQPHVDSQEDLTFLWDMFGEKSHHSPNKTMEALSTGAGGDTGLYEQLESLPAQLQPHVDSQEDLTFLWDMFGEKSRHSPVKLHEKVRYYEKQNPVPM